MLNEGLNRKSDVAIDAAAKVRVTFLRINLCQTAT